MGNTYIRARSFYLSKRGFSPDTHRISKDYQPPIIVNGLALTLNTQYMTKNNTEDKHNAMNTIMMMVVDGDQH